MSKQSEKSQSDQAYFEVFGEGRSKKAANKEAAKAMIKIIEEKFEALLTVTAATCPNKKKRATSSSAAAMAVAATNVQQHGHRHAVRVDERAAAKRRPRTANIDTLKMTCPEYGKGSINPISRLLQIQQAKNEPEPVFELISSTNNLNAAAVAAAAAAAGMTNGFKKPPHNHNHHQNEHSRRSEFLMQVTLKTGGADSSEVIKCEGKGHTKKVAKQNAAEAMLAKLGIQPKTNLKPVLKNNNAPVETSSSVNGDGGESSPATTATTTDATPETTPTAAAAAAVATTTTTTSTADEKTGEKRVKFSEEDLVVTLDRPKSTDPGTHAS